MTRVIVPSLCVGLLAIVAVAAEPPPRPAAARPLPSDDLVKRLGLSAYLREVRTLPQIKVAVLDSGFTGMDGQRAYLPKTAVVVEHYDPEWVRRSNLGDAEFRKELVPNNNHGRSMAQIIWAATGSSPDGPQFYLLNANGPTLFRRAVRYAIEQRVDVILFSGHFEGAGNYDGQGPINVAVSEAVAAGIIWVNAVGNLRYQVFDGSVRLGHDGWLRYDNGSTALKFRNRLDENSVTITLTWNDYRNEEDAGTTKDLDLFVEDPRGRTVGSSTLKQVTGPAGEGETRNPRERVVIDNLGAFEQPYLIRIRAKAGSFGLDDRLRVMVNPTKAAPRPGARPGTFEPGFSFVDARRFREVYPPADHPGVITVGDPQSSTGPTADGRTKPDVVLADSRIVFTNGDETSGSSNAAALFAAVAVMLKAAEPGLTAAQLKQFAEEGRRISLRAENRAIRPPSVLSPNWSTPTWRELTSATRARR